MDEHFDGIVRIRELERVNRKLTTARDTVLVDNQRLVRVQLVLIAAIVNNEWVVGCVIWVVTEVSKLEKKFSNFRQKSKL